MQERRSGRAQAVCVFVPRGRTGKAGMGEEVGNQCAVSTLADFRRIGGDARTI